MSDLIIPFDNNPVTNDETDTSYTVPAGKYARVVVNLSVSAFGTVEEAGTGGALGLGADSGSNVSCTSDSNSATVTLWLKSGEALTKSESAASDSETTTGTNTGKATASGTSNAAVLIGGVEVAEIDCSAYAYGHDQSNTNVVNITAAVSGTAKVHWHVAEYNNVT